MKRQFKKDGFKESRGNYSRLLEIYCNACENKVLIYQKDGPGILKRLYLDRILESNIEVNKNLICNKCKQILGIPYIYEKEERKAFRLFQDAVKSKIIKLN